MIAVITTPHWGDLMLLGLMIVGVVCGSYLSIRLVDLVIGSMRRQVTLDRHAAEAKRLADTGRRHYTERDDPYPVQAGSLLGADAGGHPRHAAPGSSVRYAVPMPGDDQLLSGQDGTVTR